MKILILISLLIANIANAQSSTNASGGEATGASGNVSYSVGQIMFTDFGGASGNVSHGVQQPFEIFLLSNSDFETSNAILLYPNPVNQELFVTIKEQFKDFKYFVTDFNGKKLINGSITQMQSKINLENLASGIYIITLYSEKNLAQKTYKIIKNN